VYHTIERLEAPAGGSASIYSVSYEPAPWFVFWRETSGTFTLRSSSAEAACFSSVYAPGKLSAPIYHRWQKYDPTEGRWVERTRISFGISGGRSEGFRGFTRAVVTPGRWRCNVETQNGALIGRMSFTVVEGEGPPELSQTRL
jgi:hypothetical protein